MSWDFALVASIILGPGLALILYLLFVAVMVRMERGRFRQKDEARKEAMRILEAGRIDDIERFEYVCRVLFISMTSVFEDKEAPVLYRRLQELKRGHTNA